MPHSTSPSTSSTSSTPVGPLILFLALCLLFQLPTFTKATAASVVSIIEVAPPARAASILAAVAVRDAANLYDNNINNLAQTILLPRAASAAPAPQWTTVPAAPSYLQPQVIVETAYTTVSVCPNCAPAAPPSTTYVAYTCTTPYWSPSTTTATITDYASTTSHQVVTTTTTVRGLISQNAIQNQGYCSTLIAQGAGLPTTREGTCGEILVEEAPAGNAATRLVLGSEGGKGSMLGLVLVVGLGFVVGAIG